jgi:ectoine hydroxylase-related dioxygenase (phytanoyl-CoA dioxygenase family)
LIASWADAFATLVRERSQFEGGLAPRERGRFYVTLPWRAPFADPNVFAHPGVLGVLDRVFAQEYVMVQLAADTPVEGSDYQTLHRDYRPLFADDFHTPLYALAVNFPLCDVDEDNGPLQITRGTHRMAKAAAEAAVARGDIPIESMHMQMGDIAIRTPLALHRGSPNRTSRPRPMVVMGYVMHWLHTPKVDLTVPRAAYAELPPPLQTLLRCQQVDALPAAPTESYVEFKY